MGGWLGIGRTPSPYRRGGRRHGAGVLVVEPTVLETTCYCYNVKLVSYPSVWRIGVYAERLHSVGLRLRKHTPAVHHAQWVSLPAGPAAALAPQLL